MEVFKYLKQIYKGENTLPYHIMLFSLLGILAILLNNVFAYLGSGLVYFTFLAVPPSNKIEFSINLFFAILIVLYLFGYEYKFINQNFHNEKFALPNFDLIPSVMVLKMLPLFFTWQVYYLAVLILGTFALLSFGNITLSYIFYSLLICMLPFMHLIFITFTYDFSLDKSLANPFVIFKYLDKTLTDVIYLFIQIIVLAIIPAAVVYGIAYGAHKIMSEPYKLSLYLLDLCLALYFMSILKFVYISGLMKIVKDKFLANRV